ncbi:MAG TPA: AIR synthase-related protein [Candidatus Paceibacterota bacterium]
MTTITYKDSGVDYDAMDPFKREAQTSASRTARHLTRFGFKEVGTSRGESAYLIEAPFGFLAHVEEGLGTKNLVADAMYALTGKSYYDQVAECTVAMIVNDIITLGALPISVAMHLAIGDSKWLDDETRRQDLIRGWEMACHKAQCSWGPGETPTLRNMVSPETAILSGSAIGVIGPENKKLDGLRIKDDDAIVMIGSSGIHANGLTLARKIADKLPEGYLTKLSDGRAYGDALLDPTIIYVQLMEAIMLSGIDLHYAVNITGHGWRKLMRANADFTYVVTDIPEPQPIFHFIQKYGPVDDVEAYGNLNMGAGFALYLPMNNAQAVIHMAKMLGLNAWITGYIKSTVGEKKVIIKPKGIEFDSETLTVR